MKTMMKPTSDMPIRIMPHHLTLSPALIAWVNEKIGPLVRIGSDAVKADVVLRLHHGSVSDKKFTASARLSLPGRDVHASATHGNLYTAIMDLEKRLARRLRKRKTRIRKSVEAGRKSGGSTSAARLEESLLGVA